MYYDRQLRKQLLIIAMCCVRDITWRARVGTLYHITHEYNSPRVQNIRNLCGSHFPKAWVWRQKLVYRNLITISLRLQTRRALFQIKIDHHVAQINRIWIRMMIFMFFFVFPDLNNMFTKTQTESMSHLWDTVFFVGIPNCSDLSMQLPL